MASPYEQIIADTAARFRVPVDLLDHVVKQESGYDPNAKSGAGALGLTQLMPATAESLGVTNPLDPQQNLTGGAKYLRQQYDSFGTWPLALAAYNAGPGAVTKYGGIPPYPETQNYVKTILAGVGATAPSAVELPAVPSPVNLPPRAATPTPTIQPPQPAQQQPLISPELLASINQNNRLLGLPALTLPPPSPAPPPVRAPVNQKRAAALKVTVNHTDPVPAIAEPIVQLARKWIGTPYSWGGGGPSGPSYGTGRGAKTKGFDCSSFAQYLAAQEGVSIPRTTYQQWAKLQPVTGQLQPGDLVFFEPTKQGPGHVGISIGSGQFIESPHTGATIRISRLADRQGDYMGARRI